MRRKRKGTREKKANNMARNHEKYKNSSHKLGKEFGFSLLPEHRTLIRHVEGHFIEKSLFVQIADTYRKNEFFQKRRIVMCHSIPFPIRVSICTKIKPNTANYL